MKGRSYNMDAAATATDEWVNGSWTVDCICGVNFDDGEEMVNCDECGVWVHTRCSRYVKADKSFACDKCKNKTKAKIRGYVEENDDGDAEETEVAQLLVELPTKTIHQQQQRHKIKMNTAVATTADGTLHRRTYRLWTERPLEDRVHVQGVPGGDPSLFPPSSSLSIPLLQLWKSSGYIPKPFKFRYSEFPCWDQDVLDQDDADDYDGGGNGDDDEDDGSTHHAKRQKLLSSTTDDDMQFQLQMLGTKPPKEASNPDPSPPPPTTVQNDAKPQTPPLHRPDYTDPTPPNNQELIIALHKNQGAQSVRPIPASVLPKSKPPTEDIANAIAEVTNSEIIVMSETCIPLESGHFRAETKSHLCAGNHKGDLVSLSADSDLKSDGVNQLGGLVLSPIQECRNSKFNEAVATSSQSLEQDGQGIDEGLEAMSGSQFDNNDGMNYNPSNAKLECESSKGPIKVSKDSTEVQESVAEPKELVKVSGSTSRLNGAIPPPTPSHKKVSAGRSSSTFPAVVFSRSSLSNKARSGSSHNPSLDAKCSKSSPGAKTKKENLPDDLEMNENKHEVPSSTSKDKTCVISTSKAQLTNKTVASPSHRHFTSVGKESLRQSSLKASAVESFSFRSDFSEPDEISQNEQSLLGQNQSNANGGQQRSEKIPQSSLQPSSKSTQSSTGHPLVSSSSPAGLSDEELALLLHQQLNSSPRVPRVPRVRHTGSLPQLSSAAAANMLSKRTSSSGGKDQNTFSRRKSKDGSRTFQEQESEVRKVDRMPSSSDSLKKSYASTHAEGTSANEPSNAVKKKGDKIYTSANSGSFSAGADDLKKLSARVNNSEDAGTKKCPAQTYRTLPGLIAEIMGTGRRMTYEELCNAVLPHWPNLRKHNGERYAYTSHSQAVLDCLRNRTEWSQLVDRGPKTSSTRKKRKNESGPLITGSEDGEDRYNRDADDKSFESNKEELPRGRRQTRKCRTLAPQGRSGKDGQKRRKLDVRSENSGSFSDSSEDPLSSEDDSRGSGMGAGRSEVSGSSHEVRSAC